MSDLEKIQKTIIAHITDIAKDVEEQLGVTFPCEFTISIGLRR
jgi:hypothetical protein